MLKKNLTYFVWVLDGVVLDGFDKEKRKRKLNSCAHNKSLFDLYSKPYKVEKLI